MFFGFVPVSFCRTRSTSDATAAGLLPVTRSTSTPDGAVAPPIRNTWAPWLAADPPGPRASSASVVRPGMSSVPEIRIGALTGGAVRLAAAIPSRHSSESTSDTASGPDTPPVEGNTASATPAASATGSAPATRVVFLVANSGNPRSCAAFGCGRLVWTTILGAGGGGGIFSGSLRTASMTKYAPTPMPATPTKTPAAIATRRLQYSHTAGNRSQPVRAAGRLDIG